MAKNKHRSYTSPKAIRYFLSTMVIVIILLLVQFLLLAFMYMGLFLRSGESIYYAVAYVTLYFISMFVVLTVVNRRCPTAYKLAWAVPILLFPAAGGIFYILARSRNTHRIALARIKKNRTLLHKDLPITHRPSKDETGNFSTLPVYLQKEGFPSFTATDARFLESGETYYKFLLDDLKGAKQFIFLEFFIIHEGVMWDSILEILEQKAKEGVVVRILYDGMGSLKTLPAGYCKKLKEKGIDAKVFQKFVPLISTMQNNRDHRKIVSIDGRIAYTGGINLSDEYINQYDRFGHWLDSGIRIEGRAATQFTRFFLEMWYTNHKPDPEPSLFFGSDEKKETKGIVIPYADSPLFESNCIKETYLALINSARDYLYITTPYLIPGDDILSALKIAAQSGVDVRLITPYHGDHAVVHVISRSYYKELSEAGVRIYEYLPGFIHSKNFVCDDTVCSVGTTNLDYRSLYLHYECGALCFGNDAVMQVKNDFLKTLDLCRELTPEGIKKQSAPLRLFISVMRLFEPML
ncbi:MAG: cardiolipin synthase [Clostridia bacterium]|nr:cardiolipin synthase [Clostridia bacterium]